MSVAFDAIRQTVFNTDELEAELRRVQDEMELTAGMLEQIIRENATVALDQTVYNARFEEISMKYDGLKASCETLEEAIRDKTARKAEAEDFIRELMKRPALITEFDPIAYHILVDRMTVFKKDRVVVRFKNGVVIEA